MVIDPEFERQYGEAARAKGMSIQMYLNQLQPSKIVWFKLSGFRDVRVVLRNPVTRGDANGHVGS